MQRGKQPLWRRKIVFVVVFLVVNLISIAFLAVREKAAVNQKLFDQAAETEGTVLIQLGHALFRL